MVSWLVIVGLLVVGNVLFARALGNAGDAFRDWGSANVRRHLGRTSSSS